MSENAFHFYLAPKDGSPPDYCAGLEEIAITRGGERQVLPAAPSALEVTEEHPPVDRMAGDLGAICEVYRQRSDTFVKIKGVRLEAGDVLTLSYRERSRTVRMKVLELEGERARVEVG